MKIVAGVVGLIALLLAGWICVFVLSGGGSHEIELPGDYRMVRMHSSYYSLCRPGDVSRVIAASVDRYAVSGYLVVGHVRHATSEEMVGPPGYFILDTRTGELKHGLNDREWLSHLRKEGIQDRPALRPPVRRFLGI